MLLYSLLARWATGYWSVADRLTRCMQDDGHDSDDEGISRVLSRSTEQRIWDLQHRHELQQAYVRLGALIALRNQVFYRYPDAIGGDQIADSLRAACTSIEAAITSPHEYCLASGLSAGSPTTPSSHSDHAIPESPAPAPGEAAPDAAQEEHLPERPRGA